MNATQKAIQVLAGEYLPRQAREHLIKFCALARQRAALTPADNGEHA